MASGRARKKIVTSASSRLYLPDRVDWSRMTASMLTLLRDELLALLLVVVGTFAWPPPSAPVDVVTGAQSAQSGRVH